jgi:integrase
MTKDSLPIDGRIAQANGRLKAGRVKCKIQRVGNFLYLRATLPPKPSIGKSEPYQQRIATGYSANAQGLALAEAEAKTVAGLLEAGRFTWERYLKDKGPQEKAVADWITEFEADYFTRRDRNPKSDLTWKKDYANTFKKLPAEAALTTELILDAVRATEADSKARKRVCLVLGKLATFAGLQVDLRPYRGNYSPSSVKPHELPSDELIAQWFYRIPNLQWRQVYALLATYGIRPSEVWHLELTDLPILTVTDETKTGRRRVWPYYPEWVSWVQLGPDGPGLPNCTGATADDLGHRVATQFRRYGVPFPPKMLRHAWAVRTLAFGLDTSEAARQMGHSEAIHCQVYHRWLDDRHHQRTFERVIAAPGRPMPPTVTLPDNLLHTSS